MPARYIVLKPEVGANDDWNVHETGDYKQNRFDKWVSFFECLKSETAKETWVDKITDTERRRDRTLVGELVHDRVVSRIGKRFDRSYNDNNIHRKWVRWATTRTVRIFANEDQWYDNGLILYK